LVAPISLTHSL
jgi:dolichyl-phosphate-mannose-protein mannosyltransferase